MALKDNWVDLEDAVEGVPDSGSDITVEPINKIAHAVIDNEKAITDNKSKIAELEKNSGGDVDLSNYYTKTETDSKITTASNNAIATANIMANNSINIALSNYYTKTEIDLAIGDIETLLGGI